MTLLARRAAWAAAILLGALPLLVTRPAPLMDWPNHVARIHVLVALLGGDGFWAQYYRVSGFAVPNAALDLVTLGLVRTGLPVETAAQLFLVLTYLALVAGFCALARALDAWSAAKPGFAILLFYSHALFWGLVNYVLGLGLLLGLLACWIRVGQAGPRLCVAALGAALLLFTHLVVAILWIAVLGGFELERLRATRRLRLAGCASSLLALVVVVGLLRLLPGDGQHAMAVQYSGHTIIRIVARKAGLFGKLLLGGSKLQDGASIAASLVCVAVLLTAPASLRRAPGLSAAALLLVALLAPERIGAGSQLDTRLVIAPVLLLAASVRIRPGRAALWLVAAAVLMRTLVIAASWHATGQVYADFRKQAGRLPSGSLMMMAYGISPATLGWQQIWSPVLASMTTEAVFRGMFVPGVFADPSEQPIALRPEYRRLAEPWNLSDEPHRQASARSLAVLCGRRRFPRILLTTLFPGGIAGNFGAAVLTAQRHFVILDACRLQEGGNRAGPRSPAYRSAWPVRGPAPAAR